MVLGKVAKPFALLGQVVLFEILSRRRPLCNVEDARYPRAASCDAMQRWCDVMSTASVSYKRFGSCWYASGKIQIVFVLFPCSSSSSSVAI